MKETDAWPGITPEWQAEYDRHLRKINNDMNKAVDHYMDVKRMSDRSLLEAIYLKLSCPTR